MLHVEHQQHVEGCQADAPEKRDAEQQLQSNCGPQHFGKVARRDGDLAENPKNKGRAPRVDVSTGLREIAAAGNAKACRQRLQQNRHQVRQHDDAQKRIAEPCAARDVGRPVAGIHVADSDQVARPGEGGHFFPESADNGDGHAAVNFGKAAAGRWLPVVVWMCGYFRLRSDHVGPSYNDKSCRLNRFAAGSASC